MKGGKKLETRHKVKCGPLILLLMSVKMSGLKIIFQINIQRKYYHHFVVYLSHKDKDEKFSKTN